MCIAHVPHVRAGTTVLEGIYCHVCGIEEVDTLNLLGSRCGLKQPCFPCPQRQRGSLVYCSVLDNCYFTSCAMTWGKFWKALLWSRHRPNLGLHFFVAWMSKPRCKEFPWIAYGSLWRAQRKTQPRVSTSKVGLLLLLLPLMQRDGWAILDPERRRWPVLYFFITFSSHMATTTHHHTASSLSS